MHALFSVLLQGVEVPALDQEVYGYISAFQNGDKIYSTPKFTIVGGVANFQDPYTVFVEEGTRW